jgi:hypothetical protein
MKKYLRLFIALACASMFCPAVVHAQASKIFVASYGNDTNDGSRGSPKRNFQAAHDAVSSGGEIVVLDTAGYGALTITKSVAITVPPGVNGFITVGNSNDGVVINAGNSDEIALRGLIIEGGGPDQGIGISFNAGNQLHLEDCTVRNFEIGIGSFGSNAEVFMHNCLVRRCQNSIMVENGFDFGAVSSCRLEENAGQAVDVFAGIVTLNNCEIAGNAGGVFADGSTVRVDNCRISSNGTGVLTANNGQVLSRGNNTFEDSVNGGTSFTGTYMAK